MMTLWTGFKQQNFVHDNKIDLIEEEDCERLLWTALIEKKNSRNYLRIYLKIQAHLLVNLKHNFSAQETFIATYKNTHLVSK